jgi:hypothetical protein
VTLHLPADPGDPGQPKTKLGRVDGSEAGAERRLLRDGMQILAHGALVCPQCGFCDHAAAAREFVAEDVYDTLANEVYLIARVA